MPQTPREEYKARRAERDRQRKESVRVPRYWFGLRDPVARVTLVLALFTLALVIVGIFQWNSISGQLTEMKSAGADTKSLVTAANSQAISMSHQLDEMQSEKRAWVSPAKDPVLESLHIDESDELLGTVKGSLQNTGRNPAMFVFVNAEISLGPLIPYGSMPNWQSAICEQATGALGTTVFPGSVESGFGVDARRAATELRQGNKLSAYTVLAPTLAACIVYEDAVTKQIHRTPLAFEIRVRVVARQGNDCCAIIPSDLPLEGRDLVLQPWLRGNLPPD
jgi:hypothetical protein